MTAEYDKELLTNLLDKINTFKARSSSFLELLKYAEEVCFSLQIVGQEWKETLLSLLDILKVTYAYEKESGQEYFSKDSEDLVFEILLDIEIFIARYIGPEKKYKVLSNS
ncbi:MAG: hypothetical protein L7U87_00100 [Chlamydiales bacterium]|nr:hypothetical protein [Chlamydiales bacterium]